MLIDVWKFLTVSPSKKKNCCNVNLAYHVHHHQGVTIHLQKLLD